MKPAEVVLILSFAVWAGVLTLAEIGVLTLDPETSPNLEIIK